MTSQGLRASPEGIRVAKTALTDKTWSQQKLATSLGITRQPVSKFFAGEPVSRSCFVQICQKLGLSWQKVAGLPEDLVSVVTAKVQSNTVDIDTLVVEMRQQRQDKIQYQCSTIQMLDIAQPIPLIDIYTSVNVLEAIPSQQWREISDLLKDFSRESNYNRLHALKHQKTLPGLEVVSRTSKLMLLGKPGSGKTIFLQYLATECNKGQFQPHRIVVFIKLKKFAEDTQDESDFNLFNYISQEFLCSGTEEESTKTVLTQGRMLILLDGLDEVPLADADKVTREIRRFTETYYKNSFVITCRIGAQQYKFQEFTEFEIADFQDKQVENFAKNWFVAVALKSRENAEATGNMLINQLNLLENQPIREFTATPMLLHFICLVFHAKKQAFPSNIAKFYEQLLNILLVRWDEVRGIKRVTLNGSLSAASKKKLLYQIAAITFEQGDYYFEQDKIQELMTDYLITLPDITLDNQSLLKTIETQHGLLVEEARGIYSFSHLTFQEYFMAKNIVENYQFKAWKILLCHLTETRWHNVFLLTVNMLPNAEEMFRLMKQEIDLLVAVDHQIQNFLIWVRQKSNSVSTRYKIAAIRAFYLVCDRAFALTPNYNLESALVGDITFDPDLAVDDLLASTLVCVGELGQSFEYTLDDTIVQDHAHALAIALNQTLELVFEPELQQVLQNLKAQLPDLNLAPQKLRLWWEANGKVWEKKLRDALINHRNIGHDWHFNQQQQELLLQYYYVNKLLVDCLHRASGITPALREEMEETLLLAIADIETIAK